MGALRVCRMKYLEISRIDPITRPDSITITCWRIEVGAGSDLLQISANKGTFLTSPRSSPFTGNIARILQGCIYHIS